MSACAAFLLAVAWLATLPLSVSADVHAAVIFTRTGERTPLYVDLGVPDLTPLGAQQAYSQGTLFRQRYISPQVNNIDLHGPNVISNLSQYGIMNSQIYALAPDDAYTAATAQAFLQGLYPPYTLNDTTTPALAATAVLANGSYIEAPLGGYQYPRIRTVSQYDPQRVFIAGQEGEFWIQDNITQRLTIYHPECINYALDRTSYFYTAEFNETFARTNSLYRQVGAATLSGAFPDVADNYINAYPIYDYLNYQYTHDVGIQSILSNNITLRGAYDELRYLADQQQWAFNSMPNSSQWIRAIAGSMLARKVLGQLAVNIATGGANAKMSLLFGEFQPMLSFFSLALASRSDSSRMYGIPDFASSMVFELFSYGDSNGSYPATSDLWVRFYFRNGTANSSELVAYPIFGHGPSETAMSWTEFEESMGNIMLEDIADWCTACDAASIFCPALNSSLSVTSGGQSSSMPPAVAGVIGAGVTLGVALLAVAALMLLGGLRFHRGGGSVISAGTRRKSSLGGFKGSAKLASDADVSFANKGAPFGVSVMEQQQQQQQKQGGQDQKRPTTESVQARERVGSWEMGDAKRSNHLSGSTVAAAGDLKADESRRSSLDIYEDAMARPVAVRESI
ncbi:putative histidine acid protein [Neofusicoccum parvum UCRNP2]|uniref:Putative histidine acid protein n=1 Tax=Botryosphaeria parva (strain UCR-NP2) TaxID=1287680 RepID=R1ETM9_BOTPV|nr:putative histidine acid protein [Neofusicoccum parvum UCRNP2]